MDWTDEIIARLRTLWAEGLSTAEIGRRMGVSKNAVVGKAHRLALPARPSPIRRGASSRPAKRSGPRPAVGPTLPPLATAASPESAPPPSPASRDIGEPAAAPRAAPELRAVSRSGGRRIACCWPIGEPGKPSFHCCDADSVAGKPYCAEHAALAYVKVRDRREEAA